MYSWINTVVGDMTSHANKIKYDILPKGCQSPFTLTRQAQEEGVLPLSASWSPSVKWEP